MDSETTKIGCGLVASPVVVGLLQSAAKPYPNRFCPLTLGAGCPKDDVKQGNAKWVDKGPWQRIDVIQHIAYSIDELESISLQGNLDLSRRRKRFRNRLTGNE